MIEKMFVVSILLALILVPLPRQKPPEIDHQHTEQEKQPAPTVPPPVVVVPVSEEVPPPKEVTIEQHVSVDDLIRKFSRIEKKLDGVAVKDERAK